MSEADRLNELILDGLLDMTTLGIAVVDRDLRYVRINGAAAAANGATPEAHIGRTMREIVPPGAWTVIEPILRRVIDDGERFTDLEIPWVADGSRVMLSSTWPLRSTDGEILGAVVTRRDITEWKQAADALRESEARFRAVVELAPNGVVILDEGRLSYLNAAALRLFGASSEGELLGTRLVDRAPPDWRDALEDSVQRAFAGEQPSAPEPQTLLRLDGERVVVDVAGVPATLGGRPVMFVSLRDVSRQKRVEEELRRRNVFVETLLEHLPLGLAVNEISTGRQLYIGSKFEHIYGVAPGSIRGVDDFFEKVYRDPVFREQMRSRIMADLMSGDITRMRWENVPIITATGEERVISASNIPLTEQDLMISTVQDVTDRKRAEDSRLRLQAQLERVEKMESVGRLAGGIAHDFNNMLGVILGSADLALSQVDSAHPLYEDLVEIRRAAERSAALTRHLLTFARRQHAEPRVLDLNEVVSSELGMLRRLAGEDIQLDWEPAAEVWPVLVDPAQLSSVLTNLCLNARHAIADVGRIVVATANCVVDDQYCDSHADAVPGEYVRLSIRDTGCGMDEATRARIFEPFFSTKPVGEATGLGLASVYGAVRQNDGFIAVTSQPGMGSEFEIHLPRYLGSARPALAVEPPSLAVRGHETILLVEDELPLLRLTQRVLEAEGYQVLAASGPEEALRLIREHPVAVHLLLTDVVMPGMNGRDLAAAVVALRPSVRQVFMSGHAADVIASRGAFQRGVKFLQKPFDTRTLLATVRGVLDRR